MGRFTKRMFDEDARGFSTDESYNIAYKKVKRIKGFYSHLRIYIIVNIIIILTNTNRDIFGKDVIYNGLTNWDTYSTAFFWGIALLLHGLRVFGRDWFFTDEWEQKKIQKYMDKEKVNTNKWE